MHAVKKNYFFFANENTNENCRIIIVRIYTDKYIINPN